MARGASICLKRGKAGRKPGSVAIAPPGTGLVGRWWWIISLEPPLPAASSGAHSTEQDKWPTLAPRAEALALLPAGVYRAGTSRCRWCALTAPLHPCLCPCGPSAVCFCGTVLTVSRTGSYPASLAIGEPGLSSTRSRAPVSALSGARASRDHLTCFLVGSLRGGHGCDSNQIKWCCWHKVHIVLEPSSTPDCRVEI